MRTLLALAPLLALALPAQAQHQQLIPPPYPSASDGARLLIAPRSPHHQTLIPTPYPHSLGPNALGNPRPQRVLRHQKLIKPPYPRQYR